MRRPGLWIWIFLLLAWTTALVLPVPEKIPQTIEDVAPGRKFLVMKTAHLLGYLVLTVFAGRLRPPRNVRLILLAGLLAHGTLTELAQQQLAHRSGQLFDAAVDHLGVALGLALSWKWWAGPSAHELAGRALVHDPALPE